MRDWFGILLVVAIIGAYALAGVQALDESATPEAERRLKKLEQIVGRRGVLLGELKVKVRDLDREVDRLEDRIGRLERRQDRTERKVEAAPTSATSSSAPQGPTETVNATAYCLTGTMANGQAVYEGAVAANAWPLGTKLYVHELERTFTVADRIGHSSELDVAMPGRCSDARQFGRRTLTVTVV